MKIKSRKLKFNNNNTQGLFDNNGSTINVADLIYPVGSIYMSVNNVSPSTLFGGTWEQIKDTFLLSAGNSYNAGSTGGAATHLIDKDNLPEHTHSMDAVGTITTGNASQGHTHNMEHTHEIQKHKHDISVKVDDNAKTVYTGTYLKYNDTAGCLWDQGRSSVGAGADGVFYYYADITHKHSASATCSEYPAFNSGASSRANTGDQSQSHTHSYDFNGKNKSTSKNVTAKEELYTMPPYLTVYMWKRTA